MPKPIERRSFLKATGALGAGIGLAGVAGVGFAADTAKGAPNARKLGWTLACAAYSFNQLTFFETVDKIASLGLDTVEGFDWQRLSPELSGVQIGPTMSAADRNAAKKKLDDAGVKFRILYCRELVEEEASRKIFEFAKDMGIETLVAEPPFEAYDMIEKLCDEYQMNLAVHNHPAPSQYWNPETTAKVCKGRGKRIGCCADTGHWCRSGFNPVDALKMLEGRVISFHLKDVSQYGVKEAECVPWGTGEGKIREILEEMHRQRFKGVFSIEYEPYRPENFPLIQHCVAYFDKVAAELAAR